MTVTLSGFADEISGELDAQLEVLAEQSIRHLELRSWPRTWSTCRSRTPWPPPGRWCPPVRVTARCV